MINPRQDRIDGTRTAMIPTRWSRPALAAACAFALIAAYLAANPTRDRTNPGGVRLEPDHLHFDEPVDGGSTHPFTIAVHNDAPVQIHLLGIYTYCGANGCAYVNDFDSPRMIEPGARTDVELEFHAPISGDFVYEFSIYTNSPGQLKIPFRITGAVRDAGEPEAEHPAAVAGG